MYNVYACQQEVADDVNAKQEARQSAKSSKEIFFFAVHYCAFGENCCYILARTRHAFA